MNLLHTYPNIKTKPATNRLALRTISVALTIALLMSMFTVVMAGVASAAWPEFQGNPNRTGQITNGVPPTTTPTVTIANLGLSLYGINVEPVLETVNGITYAYVLYPSGALSGASIAKIDVSNPTPALIWTTSLSARGVSQLSTPYLDNDYIYVGISLSATTSELASVNKITGVSTTLVSGIAGQINTPITKYGNYLYFGTYNGNNEYFQYNLSTNTYTKFIGYSDFYWAGAYSNGTHVFFGGDGGYLYCLPVASFGGSASSSNTVTLPAGAGDVRSSISRDGNYLYFTSKGGYLWRILVSNIASVSSVRVPNATTPLISTSTPAISQAEHIYVGYYSSLGGGGNGGVVTVPINNFTQAAVKTIYSGDAVQASPIVYTVGSTDYIYFTTNVATGKGYCYTYTAGATTGGLAWSAGGSNYALQGFASDNGYLVYGDNSGKLYIMK